MSYYEPPRPDPLDVLTLLIGVLVVLAASYLLVPACPL